VEHRSKLCGGKNFREGEIMRKITISLAVLALSFAVNSQSFTFGKPLSAEQCLNWGAGEFFACGIGSVGPLPTDSNGNPVYPIGGGAGKPMMMLGIKI